jgi:hypothetical protein
MWQKWEETRLFTFGDGKKNPPLTFFIGKDGGAYMYLA